ncbi:Stk1 family PASTA domain-containing Ser/Thr kinase [Sporomusa acidovorans]|uniref:non-specific serine/threonine protein kinase n=1 Tax=Sporomusa acidovorans (strain ATCC 49682 / DSM 3132 / Mol) TaxID=1123286 RepID=A0ABZ3J3R1_SPOA4|nr:Stk1 family PASTA domain-containing Ser/Thr kinase [Sporomusa acidovorans]OZC20215.1 serine/threonine-protein kinase PrkC [Sporomusa acidovorans DSM 3132]SDD41670.1 serine/threonine protein kinase [Sporomusa acidovorans]
MLNRTLDNRYTILERVGGGGMADVYRAHDKLLDRSVAVKVLRSQFTDDEEFVSRFRREAQAAAKLSHPNIVNIYDVGLDEQAYYIIMEYISGETLKDKIDREAPLPVETAVRVAMEIAEALEHAHQNNLVHCDIKPHNILVTRSGRIKVTDFGIARAVTSSTMTNSGTIIGSVHYFSPEQAKGTSVGAKSDIYSLGVVLYEMLTGQVPFTGESPISIALKHLQEEPKPPRELNPDIPPLIEAIIAKAMHKNPADRFADIGEMIADLKLAQNYLRDDHTRRLSNNDFPTQILPPVTPSLNQDSVNHTDQTPNRTTPRLNGAKISKPWLWGLLLFVLFTSALAAFLAFGKFWSLNEVTVPDVVGKQVDTARNILISNNLRVSVSEAYNEKVPAGYVISQQPEAGTTVKEQRTITIIVSKGGEITVVPDLRGLNRRDAELQIKNSGLKLGRVDEQFSDDAPPNTVINQNPRPPAQVTKGTAIDIVISKGTSPKKVVLPDFQGSLLSTIAAQLESLKLKQGKITEVPNDKYPPGTIVSQNPPPSSEVTEGSSIDFSVAKGVPGAVKRAVVQITVPDGPSRQSLQIVVTDANGRRVAYEGTHKPGERIEKTVEGAGQVRVQVYINEKLLQEQTI